MRITIRLIVVQLYIANNFCRLKILQIAVKILLRKNVLLIKLSHAFVGGVV